MYIDIVPNRNSPPAILLRKSFRKDGRVCKRTLDNLSDWPPEKIQRLRQVLRNEPLVHPDEAFTIESSTPHGHIELILEMIRRLGLPRLIATRDSAQRRLIVAMIAQRIVRPQSKLATVRQLSQTTLADELGLGDFDENALYQAMDWLHERQGAIEGRLVRRHLGEHAPVLYDVSSSYYEGATCPLMRFGYSRDGKRGRPIVVYGILADGDGRPLAMQAYAGNTGDTRTVADQIEKLRRLHDLENLVLVGDRGMLTQTQIDMLRDHPGIGWISALGHDALRALVDEGSVRPGLFDRFDLAEIRSPGYPGERLVVCFNPFLQERRAQQRGELLDSTEQALMKIQREVARRTRKPLTEQEIAHRVGRVDNRFRMAKHFEYVIRDGHFEFSRNTGSIEREQALDGLYVLRTSQDADQLPASDVVRGYKSLGKVERVFRNLKSVDLQIRPIRHRTEDRVRAHLFLCMLACYVQWHLLEALRPVLYHEEQPDPRHNPVAPPEASAALKRKKATHRTEDGLKAHSFATLIDELGTRCRNQCRFNQLPDAPLVALTSEASPIQKRAMELVKVYPVA